MIRRIVVSIVFSMLIAYPFLSGCGDLEIEKVPKTLPLKIENVDGVAEGNLYLDGRVYISGQPDEAALAELQRRGLSVVVNTRTPAEVEDREKVPFDEGQVVRDLGMSYVSIPLGGDEHPYEPAAVERLAKVLDGNQGRVLIHCGYGGRAAYLWLAYLVQHADLSLERAMARGEAMMLKPHPMSRLTGRRTKLVFVQ